jgi:P27 family predicted phage terminase small subunit
MPDGVLASADSVVLAIYAQAWDVYLRASAQVASAGIVTVGAQGGQMVHPAVTVIAKQAEVIMRAADRLGMSPNARTRLTVGEPRPGGGKFDAAAGGGAGAEGAQQQAETHPADITASQLLDAELSRAERFLRPDSVGMRELGSCSRLSTAP